MNPKSCSQVPLHPVLKQQRAMKCRFIFMSLDCGSKHRVVVMRPLIVNPVVVTMTGVMISLYLLCQSLEETLQLWVHAYPETCPHLRSSSGPRERPAA